MKKIDRALSLLVFAAILLSLISPLAMADEWKEPPFDVLDPFETIVEDENSGFSPDDNSPFDHMLDDSISTYAAETNQGYCGGEGKGQNLIWILNENGTLYISGSGAMANQPFFGDPSKIKAIIINPGVTSIGERAFRNYTALTSVSISDSVEVIGRSSFSGCSNLTSVKIPSGVKSIGMWAFNGCTQLSSVVIPDSVTVLDDYAFQSCTSLKSIIIPGSIQSIGSRAFNGCTGLTSVDIQNGVATIGNNAFESCQALTTISIPNSVTSIGSYAFTKCPSLTQADIPASVTTMGDSVFYSCSKLSAISVDSSNPSFCSVDGVLFTKDKTKLICYPCGRPETSYSIPQGTTDIGIGAFSTCTRLSSITIPADVTNISNYAFYYCPGLLSISVDSANPAFCSVDGVLFTKDRSTIICHPSGKQSTSYRIPDGVTGIGNYAFSVCTKLTSVTIPDSVVSIGSYAFSSCVRISSIVIPSGVTNINGYAFAGCTELSSVTIPNTTTAIGNYAFYSCSKLASVIIPLSVTSLGDYAFSGIPSTSNIYCEAETKPSTWSQLCFENCKATVTWGYKNDEPTTIIADGVCGGEDDGGNLSWSLTKDGTLTISGIGKMYRRSNSGQLNAPWKDQAKNIKTVVIEQGVTSISNSAFSNCLNLTSVTIPSSVDSIEINAFGYCSNLSSLLVDSANPSYCVKDDVLFTKDLTKLVAYPAGKKGTSYIIPDSVVTIEANSFGGCGNLTAVTIPTSVKTIGYAAFNLCSKLVSITIPANVTSIGGAAFMACGKLTSISVDTENTVYCSVDGVLFNKDITKLVCYPSKKPGTAYAVPNSVRSIESNAFYDCAELCSVTIPNSVTTINNGAFAYCKSLTSITIPIKVTYMGSGVFDRCSGLTDIYCEAESKPSAWNVNWLGSCSAKIHWDFKQIFGDFNGNGKLEEDEVAAVLNIVKGITPLTAEHLGIADTNRDGKVDIRDFNYIYNSFSTE